LFLTSKDLVGVLAGVMLLSSDLFLEEKGCWMLHFRGRIISASRLCARKL